MFLRVFLFLFVAAPARAAQAPDPETLLKSAIAAHQSGDFAAAISQYQAYVKLRPRSLPALLNFGAALAHEGKYEDAITKYRLALSLQPNDPGVLLNLGLAYYKEAQLADALAAWQRIPADRRSEQVLLLMADSHLRRGAPKEVIALLQPAYDRDPSNAAMEYLLGTALIRDDQVERGQRIVDHLFTRGDTAAARLLLATTQLGSSDNKKAVENLRAAVEKDPQLPGVWSLYGQARLNDGDQTGAKECFRKALEQDPNDFDANINLGAVLRLEKDYPEAARYLQRAQQIRPDSLAVQYQLGSLALGEGKVEEARQVLEGVTRKAPQFTEAHIGLATVYYRLKRREDGDREKAIVKKLNDAAQKKELEHPK